MSGGSINQAFQVTLEGSDTYFTKFNKNVETDFFEKEAENLLLLSKHQLPVPQPVFYTETLLVLPWIKPTSANQACMSHLGFELARLHAIPQTRCGLAYDNYIGSLRQDNEPNENWNDFYLQKRLLPLAETAVSEGLMTTEDLNQIEELSNILDSFPTSPPSLLHGDLWSGNVLCGVESSWFVDPACYCGNREVDIAMTQLFGGFTNAFYEAYQQENPLIADWEERIPMWLLYPLLVHVRLFGGGYVQQFRRQLDYYS